MSKMYRELSVWKRIDDTRVVRFRCFEEMETHLFCVQNADFYTMPLKADVIAKLRQARGPLRERVSAFLTPEQLTKWDAEVTKAKAFLGYSA